jgi:hypothetical protein
MTDTDKSDLKEAINDVVMARIGSYTFKIMLTVMGLTGTIATVGFYIGMKLTTINASLDNFAGVSKELTARINKLEQKTVQPQRLWTLNMQRSFLQKIGTMNPMLMIPDVTKTHEEFHYEVTP